MPIPAIIAAGASIAGTIASNVNSRKAIEAQKSENNDTRNYNLGLAHLQNRWNLEQWNRENAYNNPAAQMARMKAAGLNPDLAYGQQNLSAASPEMTAGESATPADMSGIASRQTIGDAMAQFNQARLAEAQVKLVESQAKKTDAETEGQYSTNKILESDANFRDAINSGTVKLNNMSIEVSKKGMQLTDEQITKLRKEVQQIDQSIEQSRATVDQIRQNISNLKSEQAIARLRYILDAKIGEATIKKLASDANLNYISAKQIIDKLPYELVNIQADTDSKAAAASLARSSASLTSANMDNVRVQKSILEKEDLKLEYELSSDAMFYESFDMTNRFHRFVKFFHGALRAIVGSVKL